MKAELNLEIDDIWFNSYYPDVIKMYFSLGGTAVGVTLDEEMLRNMKHSLDKVLKLIEEERNEERNI